MVMAQKGSRLLVLATMAERLVELALSRRHRRWALQRGGREFGRGHYPAMVGAHAALLAGCAWHAWRGKPPPTADHRAWVVGVLAAQALRWWCIASLGCQWNTRVVVIPGARLSRRGPYRWWRHPNYVAVVAEGVALPLAVGGRRLAVLFTAANGVLLTWRIRVENRSHALLSWPNSP